MLRQRRPIPPVPTVSGSGQRGGNPGTVDREGGDMTPPSDSTPDATPEPTSNPTRTTAAPTPGSLATAPASPVPSPIWMRRWLLAAGLYNLVWGAGVVLWPQGLVAVAGLEMTSAGLAIWQCLGMVIGVYGIGYLAASLAPLKHWPITLVGLLGKIFGPIGFVWTAARGEIPWAFGWTILTNDLIWWIPFALILRGAWIRSRFEGVSAEGPADFEELAERAIVRTPGAAGESDATLAARSRSRPLLLVFLRHAGCTFCREAVRDVLARRAAIESAGAEPVLVHMGTPEEGDRFLERLGARAIARISDPERVLYHAAGLERGTFGELFGPRNLVRAIAAARHGVGYAIGDPLQMPGTALVRDGRPIRVHRHRFAGERPDYATLACPVPEVAGA